MNIQIISQKLSGDRTYFKFQGKKAVINVSIRKGSVDVVYENAAHRAWRGPGRSFENIADALNNYKSSEMKAILQYVAEL